MIEMIINAANEETMNGCGCDTHNCDDCNAYGSGECLNDAVCHRD